MTILSIIILTTALNARMPSNNTDDALKALAKATYLQTGLDKKVKKIEKKYIPKVVRKNAAWITLVIKISNEKKITYEWNF